MRLSGRTVFWLTIASLKKALQRAGFGINAVYFGLWGTRQPKVLVDHGIRRSKVFVIAKRTQGRRLFHTVK